MPYSLKRPLALLAAVGALISSRVATPLWGAQSSCIAATEPIASRYLASLRRLMIRTDSVAAATRARYHLPPGVNSAEVVPVTDPAICTCAAALYYTDRDSSYDGVRPVFAIRMRSVYYILEPEFRGRASGGRPAIRSIVADDSLSIIHAHERSR